MKNIIRDIDVPVQEVVHLDVVVGIEVVLEVIRVIDLDIEVASHHVDVVIVADLVPLFLESNETL